MERRPLPAVRDVRWSTYDVSVLKKMGGGGKMRTDRTPSKATITNKTRPAGSFSSSYPGRAPCRLGVLCICHSLMGTMEALAALRQYSALGASGASQGTN